LPGLHAIPLTGSREAASDRTGAKRRMAGSGYFDSRWKGALVAPPENSRITAIAAPRLPVSRIAPQGRPGVPLRL